MPTAPPVRTPFAWTTAGALALALALALLGAPGLAPGTARAAPAPIPGLTNIRTLALGTNHACALGRDGHVACWGNGRFFALGTMNDAPHATPVPMVGATDISDLTVGDYGTCVRRQTGDVDCVGAGYSGMVDTVFDPIKALTTFVPGLHWPTQARLGGGRGAALTAAHEVWLFEWPETDLVPIPEFAGAVALSVGDLTVCARSADGHVQCLGPNYGGENGNGGDGEDRTPVDVMGAVEMTPALAETSYMGCHEDYRQARCRDRLSDVVALDSRDRWSCAVLASGRVACWGAPAADDAVLGLGKLGFSRTPIYVPDLTDATQVAVGGDFACALKRGGTVACWGHNAVGQLGVPGAGGPTPQTIPGLTEVTAVAAGWNQACAITRGRVACWGQPYGATPTP